MRDPRERLRDILEAIERIERHTAGGREAFEKDELIQNSFVHHLQIIGEAARPIPEDVRKLAPHGSEERSVLERISNHVAARRVVAQEEIGL